MNVDIRLGEQFLLQGLGFGFAQFLFLLSGFFLLRIGFNLFDRNLSFPQLRQNDLDLVIAGRRRRRGR